MAGAGSGLASFEKELICSICTEVLYQPLTILNCLHTFCGSCLKEWFSHQHRKASSSRSTSSAANPYSCPTCRAEVRDVQHNATVSNLLELFLAANPSRNRSPEEKEEMNKIYKPDGSKPGDKILPKVERRKDRKARREDDTAARERHMVEEARQRSLRDLEDSANANLAPPRSDRTRSASGEREERRHRRRERERQRDDTSTLSIPSTSQDGRRHSERTTSSPPATSPRHPHAIETRQREQRMSHQASLRSLVSASETGTGTGDSLDEARIMQEILDEGLLGDIDVDALTEAEQDMLAERIAELYRQRLSRRSATSSPPQISSPDTRSASEHSYQPRVSGEQIHASSRPPPAFAVTSDLLSHNRSPLQALPPPSIGRSNSYGSSVTIGHRRRTSDQARSTRPTGGSRASSVERPPASSSAANLVEGRVVNPSFDSRRPSANERTNTDPTRSPKASEVWLQTRAEDRRARSRNATSPSPASRPTQTIPIDTTSKPKSRDIKELDGTSSSTPVPALRSYDEPSITCFRCERPDLQYEIFKHCRSCKVDLCMRCYRDGKGCKHWYGFGHVAEINFENSKTKDESTEPPHVLLGRQYRRPVTSAVIELRPTTKDRASLPKSTLSNPIDRLQEGHFCDRCASFANDQFWLCDICNDGEWGFCKQCVQSHHCCTHPLLPVAYSPQSLINEVENLQMNDTNRSTLSAPPPTAGMRTGTSTGHVSANNSRPQTPNSTMTTHSQSGYDYLSINQNCDICHSIILPSSLRYHCPFHSTDFDICTSCYNSFVQNSRMNRGNAVADNITGWRKCPQGHRMIVIAFEADISDEGDGGMRRVIKHDLVGGWKMSDADIRAWNSQHNLFSSPPTSPPLTTRGTWSWKEDPSGNKRGTRTRASSIAQANNGIASNSNPTQRYPPDGGLGVRGQAHYAWWPDENDGQGELAFPRGAEVAEIENVNGDWWSGVYAGDVGVFPYGRVREYK